MYSESPLRASHGRLHGEPQGAAWTLEGSETYEDTAGKSRYNEDQGEMVLEDENQTVQKFREQK